jgi:plasmid replication initiation protein
MTDPTPQIKTKKQPKVNTVVVTHSSPIMDNVARDFCEMMEIPFVALSKNRTSPLIYKDPERGIEVKVTRHTGHFLASIYDWDIIVLVASKMQQILNNGTDIPPRTMIIPRHELLKALGKTPGKKQFLDLIGSLDRLNLTGISTSIRNKDFQYRGGFGFLDSWGYTKRKDIKEIHITLSQWLYDGICSKGALLKVSSEYFNITSGIKRFLYRTARKHVGVNTKTWEFSIEKLYAKSGSEQELKKFKYDLKAVILLNDLPDYEMTWIDRNKNSLVAFKKRKNNTLF